MHNRKILTLALVLAVGLVYYFSNPRPQNYYDYTFRVAAEFLSGRISPIQTPPSWLNEFVPFEGGWYSVFPLGAVLTMVPFAIFKTIGAISDMPAAFISALSAAVVCFFLLLIARRYDTTEQRRILLTMAVLFGTFTWTNLTMAGAWQLALGFAMIGELGAIYFTVYDRRPLLAGLFFAIAFGNRTEVLLTAPIFLYLLNRRDAESQSKPDATQQGTGESDTDTGTSGSSSRRLGVSAINLRRLIEFCVVPFLLGVATLGYNYARFHSIADFGYARIPGVLNEPWYNHGIFSIYYIPRQAWEMLWRTWEVRNTFPYLTPNGFSSSILWSSPFLLFAFRTGARDGALKYAAWLAIIVMTFLLWMHGNSGGWQFGYRYAMILLPWLFVILLESSPKRILPLEWAAFIFSFAANAYATWLFHWTSYLKP